MTRTRQEPWGSNLSLTNDQLGMLDLTGADDVQIQVAADGKTLWVNTHVARLRICQIKGKVTVNDARPKTRRK